MTNSTEQTKQLNKKGNRRGMHPNSRRNLRTIPWQKGESGNPKGQSLKRIVSDILSNPLSPPDQKEKAIQLLAFAIVRDAIKGSKEDRQEIWERLDGKVTQPVGGDEKGQPIKMDITVRSNEAKKVIEEYLGK